MSLVVEHLEKVLGDLVANRGRLAEQIKVNMQQHEVNLSQLEHFDTLIASVRHNLGDGAVIQKIEELRNAVEPESPQPPLGGAGAGDTESAAPAGANDPNGATA